MRKLNVALLIDDDSINNFINERLLKKLQIAEQVKVVLNGEEALKYIKARASEGTSCPELILLDINMPVMDGFEFMENYKNLNLSFVSKPVVILLTTSKNTIDLQRASDVNISGYLNKPLTNDKVKEVLLKHFSI